MPTYYRIGKAADIIGVSIKTLRRWADKGKIDYQKGPSGHRLICVDPWVSKDIVKVEEETTEEVDPRKVFYCRVSSAKQKDDLQRQILLARTMYPEHTIVKDTGSGLDWKRKGFLSILEGSMRGDIEEVVVFHKDRLCRFGFELVEFIFTKNGTKLLVSGEDNVKSDEQELAEDVMAIIHVFSCKQMGKRKNKNNEGVSQDKDLPLGDSKETVDGVDE